MKSETWNRPAPPGFQGLREDLPLTFYFRHLPHWRQEGATYFVTFRLADALPQTKLRQLDNFRQEFALRNGVCGTDWQSVLRKNDNVISKMDWENFCRQQMQRIEKWLDQGMGSCWLKRRDVSTIVSDAMHHFDGETYELGAYIVMPNHVHLILRPLHPQSDPLEKVLQSRKRRTSREINSKLGQSGTLWQDESFDRIIRDEEHLWRCIHYIGDNPRRAGLSVESCPRWIRPEWQKLGWDFEI